MVDRINLPGFYRGLRLPGKRDAHTPSGTRPRPAAGAVHDEHSFILDQATTWHAERAGGEG